MKNFDFKKMAVAMGILAMAGTNAMAEGSWHNVNHLMKNPAFIPGWSGALAATGEGVGEVWDGAFELYQVVPDAKPGKYTLTVNAFYRCGGNDYSKENMKDGANHNAYIYLGSAKTVVEGLFDKSETAPNSLTEANAAFNEGRYVNTVEVEHAGGDLRFGIANTGGRQDEWTAFDNFKLVGPDGEVAVTNGDFTEGLNVDKAQTIWECSNIDGSQKAPDNNKSGGVYRKTNASPYNFGQEISLEAGKYRFGVQSFLRYGGAGNVAGKYVTCKGAWGWVEEESALDRHNNNNEAAADAAYIYVTDGWDDFEGQILKPVDEETAKTGNPNAFYTQTPIMCLFDEKLDVYPDNEPVEDAVNADGYGWCDSGFEYQAAKFFVNNPDKYRNYVEFELPAAAKVWVGLKKDKNAPKQYWNPFRDFTLEKWVEGTQGIEGVEADENTPVEYYNLQGIRVAAPENGIFIVKQGNKVSKQIFK